jgi:exosortase/archaeosortase family protein
MNNKNKKSIRFLSIFIGTIILYYILVTILSESFFDPYIHFTSSLSALFLGLFYDGMTANQAVIGNGVNHIILSFGCEGTEPLVVFFAGVIAFQFNLKKKMIGLIYGLITLYFLNVLRVMILYSISFNFPKSFELFHVVIFPILFILIALLLWGYWLNWASRDRIKVES